jgi:hypothetical protein
VNEFELPSSVGLISVVNEPTHTFRSADNTRVYPLEVNLARGSMTSKHGLLVDGIPAVIVGAAGGCTGVHEHSAILCMDRLFLAVGDHVAAFTLNPFSIEWMVRADSVTCFGLYFCGRHDALICHGELEISRLSVHGAIVWQRSGRDIFTGDFALQPAFIEVRDFLGETYRFSYETGTDA